MHAVDRSSAGNVCPRSRGTLWLKHEPFFNVTPSWSGRSKTTMHQVCRTKVQKRKKRNEFIKEAPHCSRAPGFLLRGGSLRRTASDHDIIYTYVEEASVRPGRPAARGAVAGSVSAGCCCHREEKADTIAGGCAESNAAGGDGIPGTLDDQGKAVCERQRRTRTKPHEPSEMD